MEAKRISGDYGELIVYQTADGNTRLDVKFEDETVWLTQMQMAELFQTTKQNISLHINNCFKEGELEPKAVVKESLTTAADGKHYSGKDSFACGTGLYGGHSRSRKNSERKGEEMKQEL